VHLEVELAARWEVDTELEAMRTSTSQVQDLVLDGVDMPSSLVASLFMLVELIKGWVDTTTANGVRWGPRSTLVAALSHFPELKTELGLLGSGRNSVLIEDEADALWAHRMFLPRLPAAHLTEQGSSTNSCSLCSQLFAFV
jgi:hypothetical protein